MLVFEPGQENVKPASGHFSMEKRYRRAKRLAIVNDDRCLSKRQGIEDAKVVSPAPASHQFLAECVRARGEEGEDCSFLIGTQIECLKEGVDGQKRFRAVSIRIGKGTEHRHPG